MHLLCTVSLCHDCFCCSPPRGALEGKEPQRRPQERLDRRLEEVAKAVAAGYCRLQMPWSLVLAVRETVAGPRGGGGTSPLPMHPCPPAPLLTQRAALDEPGNGNDSARAPLVLKGSVPSGEKHVERMGRGSGARGAAPVPRTNESGSRRRAISGSPQAGVHSTILPLRAPRRRARAGGNMPRLARPLPERRQRHRPRVCSSNAVRRTSVAVG